jgi:GMP synthase-like glutamine amidotransferase
VTASTSVKIGIIDFNPDQNPDRREYIRRIGALIPEKIKYEGVHFRDEVNFSDYNALILSGSKLSATDYQKMVRCNSVEGADYESVDKVAKLLSNYQGPMFGICFGSQLMAHIMGGNLGKLEQTEAGYLEHQLTEEGKKDVVFGNLSETFFGAHMHTDFVKTLPQDKQVKEGSIIATRNNMIHIYKVICQNGAVRYGVQAHPEMSNNKDATFLVSVNQTWLEDKLGKSEYNNALIIPSNADYQLAQTITRFAELIR